MGQQFQRRVGRRDHHQSRHAYAVQGLAGVIAISAGWSHVLALTNDGTIWAWGGNNVGQLGDGTMTEHHVPFHMQVLNGVTAVAAGDQHSLALRDDGTVWAWRTDSPASWAMERARNEVSRRSRCRT